MTSDANMDESMEQNGASAAQDGADDENITFYLSKMFKAHDGDVKDVVASPLGLITCSRDGKVKFWGER